MAGEPTLFDAVQRLREQASESRRRLSDGTPERYPLAEVRGFTILEAEALLRHIEEERTRAQRVIDGYANALADKGLL